MSRVLMLVINPMTSDTRVDKEAATLAAAGHDVTVVATAGPGLPSREQRAGFTILRLPYRRVLKDAITAPTQRVRAERRERDRVAKALTVVGERLPVTFHVGRAWWWGRRVGARAWWLAGGMLLKFLRSRILVPEYGHGIASQLPNRVERPDIIHAHDLGPLAAAVRLARRWPGPAERPRVVYDSHELYVEQQTSWTRRERLLWRIHERRWIRHADLVITVSPGIASELQRRYTLAIEPTVVLNSPPTNAPDWPSDVRSDAGIPRTLPLAVYVGTVKPGRGVEHLVPALAHGDWHVALVGAGSSRHVEGIIHEARHLGQASRVHVLDAVPAATLPGYLATADVGVHPMERTCLNHELALPNKLFDYLFAGLPVAVSNLSEMATLVKDHRLGTTFDPADPADVSQAIQEAVRINRRPVMPADLRAQLSWETQAERLLTAYERL